MGVEKIPWETKLAILQRYKDTQGTAVVPTRYIDPDGGFRLGGWVHHLRQTKNKLTTEQVSILENLGFVWNASKERPWEIKLAALRRFYEEHHHFRVPRFHADEVSGFKLGQWIPSLRRKDAALKPARRRDLELLGFFGPDSAGSNNCNGRSNHDNNTTGGGEEGGGGEGTDANLNGSSVEDDGTDFLQQHQQQQLTLLRNEHFPQQQHHEHDFSTATPDIVDSLYASSSISDLPLADLGLASPPFQQQQQQLVPSVTSSPGIPGDLLDPSLISSPSNASSSSANLAGAAATASGLAPLLSTRHEDDGDDNNTGTLSPILARNEGSTTSTISSALGRSNRDGGGGGGVRANVVQGLASMRQPLEELRAQPSNVPGNIVQVIEL